MKELKEDIKLPEGNFKAELMFFEESDKNMLGKMYRSWVSLCEQALKIGSTRIINLPECLTEAIFSYEMGVGRSVKGISGSSSSFDHYDTSSQKRIQLKAASSFGPSSFGPNSQYDELYFIFFRNIAEGNKKKKRVFDGSYEIYKLDEKIIPNVMVNKKETFGDFQKAEKRPRFCIPKKIIDPYNIKAIKEGDISNW